MLYFCGGPRQLAPAGRCWRPTLFCGAMRRQDEHSRIPPAPALASHFDLDPPSSHARTCAAHPRSPLPLTFSLGACPAQPSKKEMLSSCRRPLTTTCQPTAPRNEASRCSSLQSKRQTPRCDSPSCISDAHCTLPYLPSADSHRVAVPHTVYTFVL